MKTIALPVKENKLSPHFGLCSHFMFYYEVNGEITKEELIPVPHKEPESVPNWLVEKGVTDVIAFGIGIKPVEILNRNKINVFVGVEGEDPEILVYKYLNGTLQTDGNLCDH